MKANITINKDRENENILLSDRNGRVTKIDRNITQLTSKSTSLLDRREREIFTHEVILQEKLNSVFKHIPLEQEIKQKIIAYALLANRFENSASINNLEKPTKRNVAYNVASNPISHIGLLHRINSDFDCVVMPLRYHPEDRAYVCIAQTTILDKKSRQHFLIVKVHENRLVKDFNLRKASQYFKFSYIN